MFFGGKKERKPVEKTIVKNIVGLIGVTLSNYKKARKGEKFSMLRSGLSNVFAYINERARAKGFTFLEFLEKSVEDLSQFAKDFLKEIEELREKYHGDVREIPREKWAKLFNKYKERKIIEILEEIRNSLKKKYKI